VANDAYSSLFAANNAVVAADMIKAYWTLPAQFRDGATWYTGSSFMMQVESIGATAAGIHFGGGADQVDLSVAPGRMLLGAPIVLFDGTGWDDASTIAQDELYGVFGNFKNYYLIDRIGMSLRRDDSINVKTDQVWFGARARFDGRVGLLNAFRLFGAAT
jgi:HK97 family phage major capsid protein